jgi:hypothetical protein
MTPEGVVMKNKKTLEDALADMEANKQRVADCQRELAAEIEAESARHRALDIRMAALTQDERRKVLNAAGMKHISAAPPPITPLAGRAPIPTLHDTSVKGPTDWKFWRHIETVELWQALLLSLNIEPPGTGWIIVNPAGMIGDIPYSYLDSNGLTDEFLDRCYILRNRLETQFARVGRRSNVELTEFIGLPLFAAWAIEFEWEGLPPELVALGHKWYEKRDMVQATQATPMTPAPASTPVTPAAALVLLPADEVPMPGLWPLKQPQRADRLADAIYAVLKDARDANGPIPFTRDVMARCKDKRPHDVIEVTHDEIKFYGGDGNTKTADIDNVRKRIERMTSS